MHWFTLMVIGLNVSDAYYRYHNIQLCLYMFWVFISSFNMYSDTIFFCFFISVVNDMLDYTAKSYGDSEFTRKIAGSTNRIDALQGTDLLIQSVLVSNSRIRSNDTSKDDVAVYIGPADYHSISSVPLSAAYVVNASGTSYRYSTGSLEYMDITTTQTSSEHSFEEWEEFHLYPASNGTVLIDPISTENVSSSLSQPFGGGDSSVVQVAAISSAAAGTSSPLVPSVFSQVFSVERHEIKQNATSIRLKKYDDAVATFYNESIFDKFAVCNQWPNPCGESDGRFIDGWISDNPAFVINVAQYQVAGGDLNETLKVILTNTNEEWGTEFQHTQVLQYFESSINIDVEPGEFNWPPGMWVPYQSPQIFGDTMDAATLDSLIEPIAGSNMTTAILKGTTIDNPNFQIQAGQKVEILLINLNEPITTFVVTPDIVDYFTEPLADMVVHIAENEELANRIKAFVEPVLVHDNDTSNPTPSSGQSSLNWKLGHYILPALLVTLEVLYGFFDIK